MSTQVLEFPITLRLGPSILTFLCSQLFRTPAYPQHSFAGQTVIVTGSNIGLGFEAACHFYRLGCAKLILAVRNASKGENAKEDIIRRVERRADAHAIEVWSLDMSSTESTLAFAKRAKMELSRLDVLVENAGISGTSWSVIEKFERCIQVNVLNTFLLALSLLPKLNATKNEFPDSDPHLTIVSSEAHHLTDFKEINAPDLYDELNDQSSYNKVSRQVRNVPSVPHYLYQISKLLEVLLVRELVSRLRAKSQSARPPVIINLVNPGTCKSALTRDSDMTGLGVWLFRLLERKTEVGGRTLVLAAAAPLDSHGEFMSDGQNQDVEAWIYTDVGRRAQEKAFDQTVKVLESRDPGVTVTAGL